MKTIEQLEAELAAANARACDGSSQGCCDCQLCTALNELAAVTEERDDWKNAAMERQDAVDLFLNERDAARAEVEQWKSEAAHYTSEAHLLADERDSLRQQLAEASQLIYMPGDWKCDKCGFQQHNRSLNAHTGNIGAPRLEELQICPNDGEAMRRITWKEGCESNYEGVVRFLNERDAAKSQLAEALADKERLLEQIGRTSAKLRESADPFDDACMTLRSAIDSARKEKT